MARPKQVKRRALTPFETRRTVIVAALVDQGARFQVLRPRLTAGTLTIEVDGDPANLAAVERAMRASCPPHWEGLAAWLAAHPGKPRAEGAWGEIIARTVTVAIPSTADSAALRAAIVADPDDDEPRRVYADWLLERGDSHGELIVTQCELARFPTLELAQRATALLEAGWKTFAGDLTPYCTQASFERGFIARVVMTIAAFARHGETVFTHEPVRTLTIANPRWSFDQLASLAATPALERVRDLGFAMGPNARTRAPLAALGASPHLRSLRRLSTSFCGQSPDDWRRLFEQLDAPALEELDLGFNHTSIAVYQGISNNRSLTSLRRIRETYFQWVDPGAARASVDTAIAGLARIPTLEHLSLSQHEDISDAAITPFFDPATPATLRSLELVRTPITDITARAIARSPKVRALESLHLQRTQLTVGASCDLLAAATNLRSVAISLSAWSNEAHRTFAAALLALPASHALREVRLWTVRGFDALRERYAISV